MATDKRTGGGASGAGGRQRADGGGAGGAGTEEVDPGPRSFEDGARKLSYEEAQSYIATMADNLRVTEFERQAVAYYQSNVGHKAINNNLRDGLDLAGDALDSYADLEGLAARSRVAEDIMVYRGWGNRGELSTRIVAQAKSGALREAIRKNTAGFEDAGFTSTSLDIGIGADSFPGKILSRIRLKAGASAIPMRSSTRDQKNSFDGEVEMLLPTRVRQRIVDYTFDASGRLILDIEVD